MVSLVSTMEDRAALLQTALDVQGRGGSRAANRISDGLKALRKERTDENKVVLERLKIP
jgi:hypothetical protein